MGENLIDLTEQSHFQDSSKYTLADIFNISVLCCGDQSSVTTCILFPVKANKLYGKIKF